MNNFILTYNVTKMLKVNPRFFSFIKNNRKVESWSSPFDGCVMFTSKEDVRSIVNMFNEYFQNEVEYFVAPYSANGGGAIPKLTWEWLSQYVGEVTMLEGKF